MKHVSLITLGCKVNSFDTALLWEELEGKGYRVSDSLDVADIYIVNTCTVTNNANSQSRQLARKVKRLNPEALVIVTGCYAQVNPEEVSNLDCVDYVVGNEEKDQILDIIEKREKDKRIIVGNIAKAKGLNNALLTNFQKKSRAFLRVQDGCDAFCTYCVIPYARGRSRSLTMDEVVSQALKLSDGGYGEIVLTGIHLGGYGLDLPEKKNLLSLLKRLDDLNVKSRFRISSIEPTEIDDEMLEFFSTSNKICPHLHIPIQSGDEEILNKMGRKYTPTFFRNKIDQIASKWTDVAIGMDVIVGFPGESNENYTNSYNLINDCPSAYLHVFPYSVREGTPAATMKEQVQSRVIKERSAALRELGNNKKLKYYSRFVGKKLSAVKVEEKNDMIKLLTDNYIEVLIDKSNINNSLPFDVVFDRMEGDQCFGTVV